MIPGSCAAGRQVGKLHRVPSEDRETGDEAVNRNLTCASAAVIALIACTDHTPSGEASSRTGADSVALADIVALNTSALGGAAALDAVDTMVKRSVIEEGEHRDIAIFATDRQGRMRIDIFVEAQRVYTESYDGQNGHQWHPGKGQTAASERGTIALSHTPQLPNHIFRLKDLAAKGHQLELVGSETTDGVEYHVLKVTLSDGFENFVLVDAESGLVTRSRNRRAYHVDIDNTERVIESRMSDFRRVDDIVHPHHVIEVDLGSGEVLGQVTLESLELNKQLPENYFRDLVNIAPDI